MASAIKHTVLLTGFGAFPGHSHNVSGDLVVALAAATREGMPDVRIETEVLPVTWQHAPKLIDGLIARYEPSIILHFGIAADATGFRIETRARNSCRNAVDAEGALPALAVLDLEGPAALDGSVPAHEIVRRLLALGIPVSLSNDAGGYLCNAVYYRTLRNLTGGAAGHITGFVHIPPRLEAPPLDFVTAIAGGLEIIRCCRAALLPIP